jgi:hypothetical protein
MATYASNDGVDDHFVAVVSPDGPVDLVERELSMMQTSTSPTNMYHIVPWLLWYKFSRRRRRQKQIFNKPETVPERNAKT